MLNVEKITPVANEGSRPIVSNVPLFFAATIRLSVWVFAFVVMDKHLSWKYYQRLAWTSAEL